MSEPSDEVIPVVGICAAREQTRWSFWDQPAHLVADSYVRAVQGADGLAVLLPVDVRGSARLVDGIDAGVRGRGEHVAWRRGRSQQMPRARACTSPIDKSS
jgi:putative glutamine amidotransferase